MKDFITNNPALVTGLLRACLALAVTFGLRLTAEQTGLIITIIGALLSFVTIKNTVPKTPTTEAKDASFQNPPSN